MLGQFPKAMSARDDMLHYQQEEAIELFLEEELREIGRAPVFEYLARYGDAIEERVSLCQREAETLAQSCYPGPATVRAATGLEIAIRFYLTRPLVQGAFLSDEWAQLLSRRILRSRTAEDRDLLPAMLRKWNIDVAAITLSDNSQFWERIVRDVWNARNDYVHKGASIPNDTARLAIECLEVMLAHVINPLASALGFTRSETGKWSVVLSKHDRSLNPPSRYDTDSPHELE